MVRITQILARRSKNNPILVGESGVGKTALIEGLAKNIVENKVPETLKKISNLFARHGLAFGWNKKISR